MPDKETHYTMIAGTTQGARLSVVTAAEARRRLTPNAQGFTFFGHKSKVKILTNLTGPILFDQLKPGEVIILRGEPVADHDPWQYGADMEPLPDPWPNPSPGIARLVELDAKSPYTGSDD